MSTAIRTHYAGPTDTRGSRVIAATMGRLGNDKPRRLTLDWEPGLSAEANYAAAARQLAERLKWSGVWVSGATEDGYVFVRLPYGETTTEPCNAAFVITEV